MNFVGRGLFGASMLLAAGGAAAQSSVTLYGTLDTFVQYLNNGGLHSVAERSGGSTASQFGLKAAEDLGGGLRAAFDLESGYSLNNGSLFGDTAALFYRQAWVGLIDEKYGALTFGRQYQPTFTVAYNTDPFRLNEVLSPLVAAVFAVDRNTLATQYTTGRTSNAMLYTSPKIAGAQLMAMYAFSASVTQPVPATTGNVLDVGVTYTGYGIYAGFSYQYQHPGTESVAVGPFSSLNLVATEHFTAALAYRLGIVNFQFNYAYTRPKDASTGSAALLAGAAHALSIAELGATIQATSQDTVEIAGIERNVRGAHDNTEGIELGYDHFLSRRTSLYLRAGYLKNNGTATTSWPGIQVVGLDGAPSYSTSQVLVGIGATHRF